MEKKPVIKALADKRLDLRDVIGRKVWTQLDVKRPGRQVDDDDVFKIDAAPFAVAGLDDLHHGIGGRVLGGEGGA